ncbi:hypothetical protein KY290_023895 [Solanum tuberosum]|uniref:Aminotransferase-like plant mobile domain-containing protein n=1 Tax=Solanum tuberosum TaxID=4113 RepID=A0ABQ7USD1_SOLTU|nr:hypothetical protein KY290_023895 [Solanum tuberosum]
MEQIIKEFDSDILHPEIFVPYSTSSSEFMLGPCFKDGFPSELESFYPLAEGEKLLLHTLQPGWQEKNTWKSWPTATEGWIRWVDRMEKVKGDTWRTADIYDTIQLSKVNIPCDPDLLYAALCFWSTSGNAFHFNFGMMSPTVFDISALTGIRPHGEAISSVLDIQSPKREKSKKIYYEKFIKVNTQREDVTEEEHLVFLNMWLCKFVFCIGSSMVAKEYNNLAIALASGRKVALAPFILSHLYRGCRSLVTRGFAPAGGPFWILQLWLQSYFPQYRPFPYDTQNCMTLGIALAQGKLKQNSFRECFKFFYSCSSISPNQFTPYSPGWLQLAEHIPSNKLALDDIWSNFLIPRDLQYGLAIGNSSVGKAGVEYYSPNQFARQFGLTQTVPLPPHQSVNASPLERIVFNSESGIREVDSKFDQLKRNFSVVEFHPNPKCTPSFESWWSTYISKTRTESVEQILDRIIGEEAIKKRRNKGQEKDKRPSKNAKRELVLPNIEHSHGVPGSSHSSVNRHEKSVDDENVAHVSSDVKSPAAQYSAEVLDKAKAEVQKLLMMPLQQVLLPENYSSLEAALPIYAESPDLLVEKARNLEELRRNLPSLLANFQEAKKQKDEYYKESARKVMLVDDIIRKQELHTELKDLVVGIDASIPNLKEIEALEMNLTTEISHLEAKLEELRIEFPASKKDVADSLATQAETRWADYKRKICV